MKRITTKLIALCVSVLCLSSLLGVIVSTFFAENIKNEIRTNQYSIATSVQKLGYKTDLTVEEIVQLTSAPMYDVKLVEDIRSLRIDEEELNRIQTGEIVLLSPNKRHGSTTMVMVKNSFISVSLHPHNTIFKVVASRVWFAMLSYTLIGALLIIISVRITIKRILKLNSATKEVAKGNFDIQIENHSNDEIGQLTDNFNKMTRELRSIEYLRKDFITSVSHEFKTPLASIQGFAKLLQKGNLSEDEVKDYTNIIVEESARLSNLSSNILKLSKLENQVILEKRSKFSLDEQMRKSILLLEHEWSKKNIEFDIELDSVDYSGDEELLQQVWINIINNAIKFSNENGKIRLRLRERGTFIQVIVEDNGIGMKEETLNRIFEKFYQGDESHSHEGNGLGLPLVKRILDLCGGSIKVESGINEGSIFIVELPLD
ncbi:HAMP domain-containing sensor histidine kinase [Serpentinicella alkaliphila]|uniref:Heme sensor protein HssS n=1 Tax=Serpentinicella alkaliphila TaxID=1734049 RepID=A0A4R2TB43_9FIRM|nr:HAMP domain-containing sensor histidine kinase [Serpentinicella alkaliphila]QUH25743.1 HAMP domain-containing histidine kinase [Serpentinicella alkaliphila]TCP99006.1 signal transduction histidine kinase [Serpentinicella alkaliphila]